MSERNQQPLPARLVLELYEQYQAMAEAGLQLKEAAALDARSHPVYVPTFAANEEERGSNAARDAALQSMTRLFKAELGDTSTEAGILCASAETVAAVERLNSAKAAFKQAVAEIRALPHSAEMTAKSITKLIEDEITVRGYRTPELRQAMSIAGIGALDLKRCYAQIRIMPPNLDVFSWTWTTNHSRLKKFTLDEVAKLIDKLPEAKLEAAGVARVLLGKCKPGEILVRKAQLKNQLRANYAWREGDAVIRESCPISGMVIAQQTTLPRKLWRDNPAHSETTAERLQRLSTISTEPYIKVLNLYRYIDR